ncbi:hypothetical protein CUU64_04445 [Bacillus sp. V5-8f]|nr:hypothetical protein CUU64_04445 [Bacillus sp. V5-8f]
MLPQNVALLIGQRPAPTPRTWRFLADGPFLALLRGAPYACRGASAFLIRLVFKTSEDALQ